MNIFMFVGVLFIILAAVGFVLFRQAKKERRFLLLVLGACSGFLVMSGALQRHQHWLGDLADLPNGSYRVMVHQASTDGRTDYDVRTVIDGQLALPDKVVRTGVHLPSQFCTRRGQIVACDG